MRETSIREIKVECQNYINKQRIIVSGFCDYNNSRNKNIKSCQYVHDGKEKITVLDSKKLLLDGVFYKLKATTYFQQNSNEIALKDVKIINEEKDNLIYNYRRFSILKDRLRKETLNIEEYFISLLTQKNNKNKTSNLIRISYI